MNRRRRSDLPNRRARKRLEQILELLRTASQPVTVIAAGTSMWPTIPPGAPVTIAPRPSSEALKPDEIVAFRRGSNLVCHRVLFAFGWKNYRYIYEKGDNNFLGRLISTRHIIGVVTAISGNGDIPKPPTHLSLGGLILRRFTDHLYQTLNRLTR